MKPDALELRHWSSEPIAKLIKRSRQADKYHSKPHGLWVSVEGEGDGWLDWAEGQGFFDQDSDYKYWRARFQYEYTVTLTPGAKILRITSPAQLREFTGKYLAEDEVTRSEFAHNINWRKVSAEYQGIIIAPYQWSCRLSLDTFWYYGWDCASGCIWDIEAIASIKLIKAKEAASENSRSLRPRQ